MNNQPRNTGICDECNSEYYTNTSQMSRLCPECASILYGYENCSHHFENGRCLNCFWNGNVSEYIQKLKDSNLNKSRKILFIIDYFQSKYGAANIVVNDHWDADKEAIGLTDKTCKFLAYISTSSDKGNDYYIALENPPVDNDLPYSTAGEFDNLSLTELETILAKHLKLTALNEH